MFNKGHSFKTEKQLQKSRRNKFLAATACTVAVITVFSFIYMIVSDLSTGAEDEQQTETTAELTLDGEKQSGVINLMLYCVSNDKSNMRFLSVVQINLDDNSYSISSFSPNETVNADGTYASLFEHYQLGGAKQLKRAVETLNGISISKYVGSTDNSFKNCVNSMGSLILSFDEQVNFRNEEFSIVFIEGEQKIRGDDLLKYFRYCGALGDEGLLMQSEVIGEMFGQYINERNIEKSDNLYSSLINYLDCDISVLDFKQSKDLFRYLLTNEFKVYCIDYFRVISD